MLMTLLMGLGGSAYAHGSDGAGDLPRGKRLRAISYINPDLGLPTANPSVDDDSSCESPDRDDRQRLSTATKDRNVHNDACLVRYGKRVSRPVAWISTGVGYISACPDPDDLRQPVARTAPRPLAPRTPTATALRMSATRVPMRKPTRSSTFG